MAFKQKPQSLYLIQRCTATTFKQTDYKNAKFSDVMDFDYMGASEFEWGAIPKSMERFGEREHEFVEKQIPFKSGPVKFFFYLPKDWTEEEREKYFSLWYAVVNGSARLKEMASFDHFRFRDVPVEMYAEKSKRILDFDIEHDVLIFTNKKFKAMLPVIMQNSVDYMKAMDSENS